MRQRLKKEKKGEELLREVSKKIVVTAEDVAKKEEILPKKYRRAMFSKEALEEARKLASILDKSAKYGVSKLKWVA